MSRTLKILVFVALPALSLLLGVQLGWRSREALSNGKGPPLIHRTESGGYLTLEDPERDVNIDLLWNVWRLLLSRYIAPEQLQPRTMLIGAIRGLVDAIGDPYTTFLTPEENQEFRDALQGALEGIGAELMIQEGNIVVVAPLRDSPAERAGLLPGDFITAVDGEDTEKESLSDVVRRIRGPKGSKVSLSILRKGAALTISIKREDIHVPSVEEELKNTEKGPIAYIAINQFGDGTVKEVTASIASAKKSGVRGLILDVRFNGGGYLDGAVALASLFLQQGKVVSVKGRGDSLSHHYVTGRPALPDLPIVILVNQGSASAAEILAGALQDHKRATVIGTKSFGKGTVQEVIDLPEGSGLRLTTAHWLLPSGRNLAHEGIAPDIVIDRSPEDIDAKRDPQLDAALQWFEKNN
ncbi:S41 family peptidase [Candidatus Peregrinibacteria bacterium]|nr:S41 family peptidase [Candidatus Peregrinibacteria bacterium]